MIPLSVVVCACAVLAAVTATNVQQCPGKSYENLSDNVVLAPCTKLPCRLKKGTNQHITINFTPDKDLPDVKNHVNAEVFGAALPFVGVDALSICDKIFSEGGEKMPCPLKAGTKYVYKDSFPILPFYPSISVKIHWALTENNKDIICFEIPAKIT